MARTWIDDRDYKAALTLPLPFKDDTVLRHLPVIGSYVRHISLPFFLKELLHFPDGALN